MFKAVFLMIGVICTGLSIAFADYWLSKLGLKELVGAREYAVFFWAGGIALTGALSTWYLANDMAVWSVGAEYVKSDEPSLANIQALVAALSLAAGLKHQPKLAVYPVQDINAIVVARSRRSSTIAISKGALDRADDSQMRAIIGYCVTKIASGEIIPLLLLQGVVMAFTLFPTRMFALLLGTSLRTAEEDTPSDTIERVLTAILEVLFLPFTALLIRYYSREIENRADRRAAAILGADRFKTALKTLESESAPRVFRESYALPHKFGMTKLPRLWLLGFHASYGLRAQRLDV
ncbi:MAG: hypothetical protein FJ146_01230 [Deltaproteobacteria bacterium]|nr:hypothetical protein [Deltaproteobacteria bacterium]